MKGMSKVIEVSGLGKKYLLRHQRRGRYNTLRENISSSLKDWGGRLLRTPGTGSPDPSREEFWALKGVSFDVEAGDRIGIIGRNGAGKTTLLKLLSRITEPTEGRIRILGRVASLLEVGTGFHPELSGRENIFLNGAILGMRRTEIQAKLPAIVDFAEVERFLDTPVKRYSSGMYLRLAFSVAAHLEPEILLVDEVLAVGDHQFQKKCLGKMREVGKEGRTILFVSHNMSAIRQLCSKGILLEGGKIRAAGDADPVVEEYLKGGISDQACVDLSGFENRYGNGEIHILSLELQNACGGRFAVRWDEPIVLGIRFRVNQRISNVSFGVGCQTTDLVPLFTVRTSDRGTEDLTLDKTKSGLVTVKISHNLNAGRYNLMLGVASGNYSYYYNPAAAQLDVIDAGSNREYLYRNPGIIHCDSEWSHA